MAQEAGSRPRGPLGSRPLMQNAQLQRKKREREHSGVRLCGLEPRVQILLVGNLLNFYKLQFSYPLDDNNAITLLNTNNTNLAKQLSAWHILSSINVRYHFEKKKIL